MHAWGSLFLVVVRYCSRVIIESDMFASGNATSENIIFLMITS